ncbi:MAG: SRPBCC domain-containing protein [Bacteroidetes bacterium]|nr:SRPBCC domain-containing protein [Bacteroidota bacterium]
MSKKKATDRIKLEMEFEMHSSVGILYNYISTATGLQSWFADNVNVHNNNYDFSWEDGTANTATLVKNVSNKHVSFHWQDAAQDENFEFHIVQDELTGDVELLVIDYCDAGEEETTRMLWESQVDALRALIGA